MAARWHSSGMPKLKLIWPTPRAPGTCREFARSVNTYFFFRGKNILLALAECKSKGTHPDVPLF